MRTRNRLGREPVGVLPALLNDLAAKESAQNQKHVYSDRDRSAAAEADLIELQCTFQKFEKGSEKMRQVTTAAGATSMTLHCAFRDKVGNSLLERDITGKARFFGGNLKATYDFAKKATNVAAENFSAVAGRKL